MRSHLSKKLDLNGFGLLDVEYKNVGHFRTDTVIRNGDFLLETMLVKQDFCNPIV